MSQVYAVVSHDTPCVPLHPIRDEALAEIDKMDADQRAKEYVGIEHDIIAAQALLTGFKRQQKYLEHLSRGLRLVAENEIEGALEFLAKAHAMRKRMDATAKAAHRK